MSQPGGTIVGLAGRRIDAPDAQDERFPEKNVPRVTAALQAFFEARDAVGLVCSAACGADIVALEVAGRLGIAATIILPFSKERFRETSVVDRGAEWGPRFDAVVTRPGVELIVVEPIEGDDDAAYAAVTARILSEAQAVAKSRGAQVLALAVWDENPRSSTDATKDFLDKARRAGFEESSIATR
jgi:hypothetical protein